MDRSAELERIKKELGSIGARPIRSFGQNFLLERSISGKIASEVPDEYLDCLVEIGPGLGVLTEALLERGARVTAIEKDGLLAQKLQKDLSAPERGTLEVIVGDAVRVLPEILEREKEVFIVSNLPFNISSRLTGEILDRSGFDRSGESAFRGAIIMYQEEFAKRLIADHGSKKYGRITVMFRSRMDHRLIMDVQRTSFYPQPRVDATVIGFEPKQDPGTVPDDGDLFKKLVHVVFLNRRKKMKNSVNPRSLGMELDMEDITWILEDMDLADRRPEELPPGTFIELSNRFSELS